MTMCRECAISGRLIRTGRFEVRLMRRLGGRHVSAGKVGVTAALKDTAIASIRCASVRLGGADPACKLCKSSNCYLIKSHGGAI